MQPFPGVDCVIVMVGRLTPLPCACANLRRAARAVTREYEAAFNEFSLKATGFTLLQALEQMGPSSQRELGDLLALDKTTLTRAMIPLVRVDWITLVRKDQREMRWELARSARGVLRVATVAWEEAQQQLHDRLGAERWTRLMQDLAQVPGPKQ